MQFKSSIDFPSKIISIIIIILFAYFVFTESKYVHIHGYNTVIDLLRHFLKSIILFVVIIISYLLSVNAYSIHKGNITIHKVLGNKVIKKENIKSIEEVYKASIYLRLFGIGGLFGYSGIFLTTENKIASVFASHKHDLVRINLINNKTIYISPDQYQDFIEHWKLQKNGN